MTDRNALALPRHAVLAVLLAGCQAFTPAAFAPTAGEASTSGAAEVIEVASVESDAVLEADVEAGVVEAPEIEAAEVERLEAPNFLGQPDAPVLDALVNQDIVRIQRGGGGRSIGFKIWLADGTRAYFKPEQSAGSTRWYAEVAAYRLDRALGLGRTAPSVVRTISYDRLARAAGSDARVDEIVQRDGQVRGALIAWIDGPLERAPLGEGWEHWVRVNGDLPAVDPFVAPPHLRRADRVAQRRLAAGRAVPTREAPFAERAMDREGRDVELSNLVVFDYLTANQDRWGGNYTNVRTVGEGGDIIYLDNGAGFRGGRYQRDRVLDSRIEAVQRFDADTVQAVRDLDVHAFATDLEAQGVTLSRRQRRGLETRITHVLEHVAAMQATHGDAATL